MYRNNSEMELWSHGKETNVFQNLSTTRVHLLKKKRKKTYLRCPKDDKIKYTFKVTLKENTHT